MSFFHLLTPLVHALGRLKEDNAPRLKNLRMEALPGEFVAFVNGQSWRPTGITVHLHDKKASIRTANGFDNSALNIEFALRKKVEAIYYFVSDLRTMQITGKENALLFLPANSGSSADFLATVGAAAKPGSIQITECNWLERTITGQFAAIVGSSRRLLRITGSFNQLRF